MAANVFGPGSQVDITDEIDRQLGKVDVTDRSGRVLGTVTVNNSFATDLTLSQVLDQLSDATSDTVIDVLKLLLTELQTKTEPGDNQSVTGSVNVNNFPATQKVSDGGGSLTVDGQVNVGNFPGTQNVNVTNSTADPVNVTVVGSEAQLTERMLAKAPASGYALWFDTADNSYLYTLEAPTDKTSSQTGFRGVRVTLDADGNPVGKVESNTAGTLTFDNRKTDGGWS